MGDENWPPNCDGCGSVLTEPGALIFGPPSARRALKLHICRTCWPQVWTFARSLTRPNPTQDKPNGE